MRASRESVRSRGADVRAAFGLIATGLLLGGVASVMLRSGGEILSPADAQAAAAKAPPARSAAAVPAKAPAAQAVKPAAAPVSKPATAAGAMAPAAPKVAPAKPAVQVPAQLDDQVAYQYNALGRRDPFQPLVGGEFIGDDMGGDAPPDIGALRVVGIVWGASDKFALVEDGRGNSLVLRTGDKVMNGVVEALQRESVVVKLTVDGQTQSVAIPLTRKGEKQNGSR